MGRQSILDVRVRTRGVRSARWRLGFAAATLALGVLATLYGLWLAGQWTLSRFVYQNPAFGLRSIEVVSLLPADVVRDWAGIRVGDNLIELDMDRVRRSLELVPLIASASLERMPPDALRIRVLPREPVAEVRMRQLRPEGGVRVAAFYVDEDAYVFQLPEAREEALRRVLVRAPLPQLVGLPVQSLVAGRKLDLPAAKPALRFARAFAQSAMAAVTELVSLDVSRPDVFQATTLEGSCLTMGFEPAAWHLERWRCAREYAVDRDLLIATLDLSVSNYVPVVFQSPKTPAPPEPSVAPPST